MSKRPQRNNRRKKNEEVETSPYESTTVGVYRTAATVKGGRRFSFSALSVVGDRKGTVGYGYGKATEVPSAIEKAEKIARREVKKVALKEGTIPHEVLGRFGASRVKLVPASPGTGVIAGATVRAVLELSGVRDCMTKAYGSTNQKNLVKATVNALEQLRYCSDIERLRGVELGETEVDEMIKRGIAFMPAAKTAKSESEEVSVEAGTANVEVTAEKVVTEKATADSGGAETKAVETTATPEATPSEETPSEEKGTDASGGE